MVTKIGFVLEPSDWIGGRNYFGNLFAALENESVQIKPVVFTGKSNAHRLRLEFSRTTIVPTSLLDRKSPTWFAEKSIATLTSRNVLFQRLLQKSEVPVLSHLFWDRIGAGSRIISVGWIPDFQHLHLPEFFSEEERHRRNRSFMELCSTCSTVIVSSESARQDLAAFAPRHAAKAQVLRFVARPVQDDRLSSLSELKDKYCFREPYFLLPNQFWAHKNHRLVLSALRILKQRSQRVLVLATGLTSDHRHPRFYQELMDFAKRIDVLDMFRVLEVIPFEDLATLLSHAVAIINPSRFEGWSTSVEEAKSNGKTVLLSDIPVHKEQSPQPGFYFDVDDAEGLANALWKTRRSFDPTIDAARQQKARESFTERQLQFADVYQQIILSALRNGNTPQEYHAITQIAG